MHIKQYTAVRIIITMLLSASIAVSVAQGNFFLPIPAVALAFVLLLFLRGRVQEVIADERDYAIGGIAARWTISIFSFVAVALMFIFLALKDRNPVFDPVAQTLAYSTCGVMILYALLFKFLRKRTSARA